MGVVLCAMCGAIFVSFRERTLLSRRTTPCTKLCTYVPAAREDEKTKKHGVFLRQDSCSVVAFPSAIAPLLFCVSVEGAEGPSQHNSATNG